MISSSMTSKFLQRHDIQQPAIVLKRTRSSTKQFLENNNISLVDVRTTDKTKIFLFRLGGRKIEIKVELDEEEIVEVSCADCSGEHFTSIFMK